MYQKYLLNTMVMSLGIISLTINTVKVNAFLCLVGYNTDVVQYIFNMWKVITAHSECCHLIQCYKFSKCLFNKFHGVLKKY